MKPTDLAGGQMCHFIYAIRANAVNSELLKSRQRNIFLMKQTQKVVGNIMRTFGITSKITLRELVNNNRI